jgi:AcrR family transcriptional regulator
MKLHAILGAALDLFEERGYGGTPVPQVAERAGVAVGTLYRYFPGKEGLVNALYRHWKHAFADAIFAAVEPGLAPRVAFERIWGALAAFASTHPAAFAFLETHAHGAYLDAESGALSDVIDARLCELIRTWQITGAVRAAEPAVLLAQVFGGFVGVVRHLRNTRRTIPPDVGDLTRAAAWAALAAPSQTEETPQ